jgi:hypothetical protein
VPVNHARHCAWSIDAALDSEWLKEHS